MNIPQIKSYEEQAIDTVTSIINRAKESLGLRQTLTQLAGTRDSLATPAKVVLTGLCQPLAVTSERLLTDTIEKKWQLTKTFMYILKYMGGSQDECSQHYYFEAIFSQPTPSYPIPQATVSVFFRVAEKYTETPEIKVVPMYLRGYGKLKFFKNMRPREFRSFSAQNSVREKISLELSAKYSTREITFTIEGQHRQNDVRYVTLTADEILAVLKMKLKFFQRIEHIRLF